MMGASCLIWEQNREWYEYVEVGGDEDNIEIRLTEKAPPEAVELFRRYQEKQKYAKEHGIVY